jgi:hypothetical protein
MTRYKLRPAAFRAEVLNAAGMVAEMRSRAERVKAAAEAIAPADTGQYAASFTVSSGTGGGVHRDRAYAKVRNSDPAAPYVEYGNGREGTAQHVMQRAKDAL